jgi:hypothetical protein
VGLAEDLAEELAASESRLLPPRGLRDQPNGLGVLARGLHDPEGDFHVIGRGRPGPRVVENLAEDRRVEDGAQRKPDGAAQVRGVAQVEPLLHRLTRGHDADPRWAESSDGSQVDSLVSRFVPAIEGEVVGVLDVGQPNIGLSVVGEGEL